MRYNEKYDRYIDDDLVIYRWSKTKDKLVQCSTYIMRKSGYVRLDTGKNHCLVHRLVYETFVGEIPEGMEIDHINTIRTDNRLENLRCVTRKENHNNPLTIKHYSESRKGVKFSEEHKRRMSEVRKGKPRKCKPSSIFGIKFKEHFNKTAKDDAKLYARERIWYLKHNKKCRWENE